MSDTEIITEEIRQIKSQYESEVTSARRTWPLSLRQRVVRLFGFGISPADVYRATLIPRATLELWLRNYKKSLDQSEKRTENLKMFSLAEPLRGSFKCLTVKADSHLNSVSSESVTATWTVTLPGSVQVSGMDLDSIIQLSRRLSS